MNSTLRRAAIASTSLAAALTLAACGSDDTHGGMSGTSGTVGTSSTAPSAGTQAHNDADVAFATQMIPHHEQAVEMADLAATRAATAEVTQLATEIKQAQDPEIRTMSGWLAAWGQPVPTPGGHDMSSMDDMGMSGMMTDEEMQQLSAASGADFDRSWLTMMIKHHEGAVAMATTQLAQGQSPEAKVLAQQIIDAQKVEIATMQQLLPTITG